MALLREVVKPAPTPHFEQQFEEGLLADVHVQLPGGETERRRGVREDGAQLLFPLRRGRPEEQERAGAPALAARQQRESAPICATEDLSAPGTYNAAAKILVKNRRREDDRIVGDCRRLQSTIEISNLPLDPGAKSLPNNTLYLCGKKFRRAVAFYSLKRV